MLFRSDALAARGGILDDPYFRHRVRRDGDGTCGSQGDAGSDLEVHRPQRIGRSVCHGVGNVGVRAHGFSAITQRSGSELPVVVGRGAPSAALVPGGNLGQAEVICIRCHGLSSSCYVYPVGCLRIVYTGPVGCLTIVYRYPVGRLRVIHVGPPTNSNSTYRTCTLHPSNN